MVTNDQKEYRIERRLVNGRRPNLMAQSLDSPYMVFAIVIAQLVNHDRRPLKEMPETCSESSCGRMTLEKRTSPNWVAKYLLRAFPEQCENQGRKVRLSTESTDSLLGLGRLDFWDPMRRMLGLYCSP